MGAVALAFAPGPGQSHGGQATSVALLTIRDVPLVVRAIRGLSASGRVGHSVIIASSSEVEVLWSVLAEWDVSATVVSAGDDLVDALGRALEVESDAETVLVHELVRACTPPDLIGSVVAEVEHGAQAVVPVLPLVDTVKRVDSAGLVIDTPDRSSLRVPQTPLGFPVHVLTTALRAGPLRSPLDLLGRAGPLTAIPGHPDAMRVSTPFDVTVAEAVLSDTDTEGS